MRILVTGASGQLGAEVVCVSGHHALTPFRRDDLNVARHADVLEAVRRVRPDTIINCAAYNNVDGAEQNAMHAFDVNAAGVRALAMAADEVGATLLHYSSDFVFDGDTTQPYVETDRPHPLSVYAASKLFGEWFAGGASRHYVLRLSSVFGGGATMPGENGKRRGSTIDRMFDAIMEGREVRAFTDRVVSPSYIEDVARASLAILERRVPSGVYHCVNTGMATWYELAQCAGVELGRPARIIGIKTSDVVMTAARPAFCALSNAKLRDAGIEMPAWRDALRRYAARRLNSSDELGRARPRQPA